MTQENLRILFTLVIIFLIAQFIFAVKVSEPYPSILYPGFSKPWKNSNYNSYRSIEIAIVFTDGEIINDDKKLFRNFNPSAKRKILDKYFNDKYSADIQPTIFNDFREYSKKEIIKYYKKEPRYIRVSWYKTKEYFREVPIRIEKSKYKSGILIY